MKGIFKIFITLLIAAVALMILTFIWVNYLKPLEIPNLKSQSSEFGEISSSEDVKKNYELYIQKLKSEEFIDTEVNVYIDTLVSDFKANNLLFSTIANQDKAALKSVIDTYKINDNLVSIKVTSMTKKLFEEEYTTQIKTFNYNLANKGKVTLDELFKSGYKDKLGEIYSDNYLLKNNEIEFYSNDSVSSCTYNSLKEYGYSKTLTAENFDITQEEYENLFLRVVDKNKKMVAITFDDGPNATNTSKILDILNAHNARATFFMLGQNVTSNREIVKSVYNNGNEIGIHTWSHKQLTKLSVQEIQNEISKTSDAIYSITNERPRLVRPPYGAINNTVKSSIELPLILWNIDSLDWKSRDEKQIVPLVMNDVQDGDIILLHDIHATTVPAVEKIVMQLDEAGYQMVTVSELLEAKEYDTTQTKVFYSGRQ